MLIPDIGDETKADEEDANLLTKLEVSGGRIAGRQGQLQDHNRDDDGHYCVTEEIHPFF